jgi:hypothetical protein
MKFFSRIVFLVFFVISALGCASTNRSADIQTAVMPEAISVSLKSKFAMSIGANGVLIYECRVNHSRFAWEFLGPEATLFDENNKLVGALFAGPTWELLDGSSLLGSNIKTIESPVVGAMPWALFSTRSAGRKGVLSRVTSLQQVNTVGGEVPKSGCNSSNQSMRSRVPFSAMYFLYVGE